MKTTTVLTFKAKKGMVIAEDILTSSGQLLVPKNTVFDSNVKNTLYSHSIFDFLIWENDENDNANTPNSQEPELSIDEYIANTSKKIKPNNIQTNYKETSEYLLEYNFNKTYIDDIDFENRSISIKSNPDFKHYDKIYTQAISYFRMDLNDIAFNNKKINLHKILDAPLQIINSNIPSINVFDMLLNLTQITDPVYSHSFNVALISGVIGEWLHFSDKDIKTLILSGLLHDIGKLLLPSEVLHKTEPLTDEDYKIIRSHPILGYNAIKDQNIDPRIKACVLMHHEKCDGSGYPSKTLGNMLPEFVKIITIADIFDAMMCARKYRKSFSPFEIIKTFEEEGLQKYDVKILLTFLEKVSYSYINRTAKLNTGEFARIATLNKRSLSRPIIELNNELIDLSKDEKLSIIGVL